MGRVDFGEWALTLKLYFYGGRASVSILTTILFVLTFVRLLLPPGICVCQLSSPAAHLAVAVFGGDPGEVPDHHDDDHHPGCPASHLAVGLGVQPSGPSDIGLTVFAPVADAPVPATTSRPVCPSDTDPDPSATPRHLALCVLLV